MSALQSRFKYMPVEELDLSVRDYNVLKRMGIDTIGEILELYNDGSIMGVRSIGHPNSNLREGLLDAIKTKSQEMGIDVPFDRTERPTGKAKCDLLRSIRIRIANLNEIDYEPIVCTHDGPCRGTCEACDAEEAYINEKIEEQVREGKLVSILNGAKDLVSTFVERFNNDDEGDNTERLHLYFGRKTTEDD